MNGLWLKALLASLLLAVPAWAGNPAQPEVWDTGGGSYEADPADTDAVGQGDDHMRAMKRELRDRLEVEHHFATSTGDDTGLHRLGSGRGFYQSAVPTALEQADHDNDGGGPGDTTLANQDYQSQEVKGLGRIWVDSDDMTIYAYGTAEIEGSGAANGWFPIAPGEQNILYNGSFEIDDGSDLPDGWLEPAATADLGTLAVAQVSDDIYGLGFAFTGTADHANDYIYQRLTGLHAGATYLVYGMVNPTAGDTCRIATNGAGTATDADVTSSNAGGFEVLLDTFVMADPTDLVDVRLHSVGGTDVCEWDHVAVVEYAPSRRQLPSRLVDETCLDNAADKAAIQAISVRVQIPWPKSVIRVHAVTNLVWEDTANISAAYIQLDEAVDGGAETTVGLDYTSLTAGLAFGAAGDFVSRQVTYLNPNPTPGSEYVYTIDVIEGDPYDSLGSHDQCLWLEAYPL